MLRVGSFSFGSPVSASTDSKTIFEINTTDENNNISTTMFSGSGKKSYTLVPWLKVPRQKVVVVDLLIIQAQAYQDGLSSDNKQGGLGSRLIHYQKSRQIVLLVQ